MVLRIMFDEMYNVSYQTKNNESLLVPSCFEYFVICNFIKDALYLYILHDKKVNQLQIYDIIFPLIIYLMTLFSVHFQKSCHHCESMHAIFRCSYHVMRPSSGSFYSNEDAMKIYLHATIVFWVWVETNVLNMMKAWFNLEDVFKCIIQKYRNIKDLCMKIHMWNENNSAFYYYSMG